MIKEPAQKSASDDNASSCGLSSFRISLSQMTILVGFLRPNLDLSRARRCAFGQPHRNSLWDILLPETEEAPVSCKFEQRCALLEAAGGVPVYSSDFNIVT
jgi:hypothetical protein